MNAKKFFKGFFVVVFLFLICLGIYLWPKFGGEMAKIITGNISFRIIIVAGFAFAIFQKFRYPKRMTVFEMIVQVSISTAIVVILFVFSFNFSTDVVDFEIWNGRVLTAEYYEEWTEEVQHSRQVPNGTDANGNTTYRTEYYTTNEYRPPEWSLRTTLGEQQINSSIYQSYKSLGKEAFVKLNRSNQVSLGDGNKYLVKLNNIVLPASKEKKYLNYLKASKKTIKKTSGGMKEYEDFILPYPRVHSGKFGYIDFDRVQVAKANIPKKWKTEVDSLLDKALVGIGPAYQANVIVYVAGTSHQAFSYALEEAWVNGKKNDIIILLGVSNFPKVDFVHVTAWTENEGFKVELKDKILKMKNIDDPQKIVQIITSQIKRPGGYGFKRLPMKKLEYLINDIQLPWWWQLLIVLIDLLSTYFMSSWLIKNEFEEK